MFVIINNDLNCHVLWSIRVNHHVCYHYYYCCHSDLLYCALSISDIVWLFQSNGFNMKHYSWPTVKRSSFPTRVNIQRSTKPTLYHNPFVQPILGDMLWVLLNLFFQKNIFLRKTQKYKDPSVNAKKKKVPRDSRYIYIYMNIYVYIDISSALLPVIWMLSSPGHTRSPKLQGPGSVPSARLPLSFLGRVYG